MRCDFCGVTIDVDASSFLTSEEVQRAVWLGLTTRDISEAVAGTGATAVWSDEVWNARVADEAYGWLLCPGCAVVATRFLTEGAEGPKRKDPMAGRGRA